MRWLIPYRVCTKCYKPGHTSTGCYNVRKDYAKSKNVVIELLNAIIIDIKANWEI